MYKVQYYSAFYDKWQEYTAITHNPAPQRPMTENDAIEYMARLQRSHPRDKFRIVPTPELG